jgi:hypothetical protein
VSGSGFIISSDGYILTNYHVIKYAVQYGYELTVILRDGSEYPARSSAMRRRTTWPSSRSTPPPERRDHGQLRQYDRGRNGLRRGQPLVSWNTP